MAIKDLSGQKFNRLQFLRFSHRNKSHYLWECLCDCGNTMIVDSYPVRKGIIKSCGCLTKETNKLLHTTHDKSHSRIYRIWGAMMSRCYNKNNVRYSNYGGAGVIVCDRWQLFINFYNDLKDGYNDMLTLDRFPNKKGNYEQGNVRWATNIQQQRNKNSNKPINIDGVSLTIMEWAELIGGSYETIRGRIRRGWSNKEAVYGKSKPILEYAN